MTIFKLTPSAILLFRDIIHLTLTTAIGIFLIFVVQIPYTILIVGNNKPTPYQITYIKEIQSIVKE